MVLACYCVDMFLYILFDLFLKMFMKNDYQN